MKVPKRQISPERKAIYYLGMGLVVVGVLLFFSNFLTRPTAGNLEKFGEQADALFTRAVLGMILIVVGAIGMGIGSQGLAGSGVVLDPEEAREDLEPWSRMKGGMLQDALSEVEVVNKLAAPPPEIKVRCRACQALNDENAKHCDQCGAGL